MLDTQSKLYNWKKLMCGELGGCFYSDTVVFASSEHSSNSEVCSSRALVLIPSISGAVGLRWPTTAFFCNKFAVDVIGAVGPDTTHWETLACSSRSLESVKAHLTSWCHYTAAPWPWLGDIITLEYCFKVCQLGTLLPACESGYINWDDVYRISSHWTISDIRWLVV